jgi:transposase-like protein
MPRSWTSQQDIGTKNLIPFTNAIERLHEEFKRRIKTQTVLPSAHTAAMLFWALLASGQICMRKVDGWKTLATKLIDQPIDLAAGDKAMAASYDPIRRSSSA